jgi:repressor LexA
MDRRFVPSEDAFFLKVKGESMTERGILDGDYVMLVPSARPKDGDIIGARLGEEATVKTLSHRGSTVVLEPACDGERAIEVGPDDDFAILGVVCGVFRPFWEQDPPPTLATDDTPAD